LVSKTADQATGQACRVGPIYRQLDSIISEQTAQSAMANASPDRSRSILARGPWPWSAASCVVRSLEAMTPRPSASPGYPTTMEPKDGRHGCEDAAVATARTNEPRHPLFQARLPARRFLVPMPTSGDLFEPTVATGDGPSAPHTARLLGALSNGSSHETYGGQAKASLDPSPRTKALFDWLFV
jgi:hypothetical protein